MSLVEAFLAEFPASKSTPRQNQQDPREAFVRHASEQRRLIEGKTKETGSSSRRRMARKLVA